LLLLFEPAPDRFCLIEIAKNVDARDEASPWLRWRSCRPAFDRGSQGHWKTCLQANFYISAWVDLCKESSTKGNDDA
jgi:hypothetical protein